jgi:uncharacterized cupin superfamily protein
VLAGEIVLVTDDGEETLRAGDAAGFPANEGNGHCLQNRSGRDATVLEVGTRQKGSVAYYPDIDTVAPAGGKPAAYTHRDGTPYREHPPPRPVISVRYCPVIRSPHRRGRGAIAAR